MCGAWSDNSYALINERIGKMDVTLVLKVAGMGMLVSAAVQILAKTGRDEQAMMVTITGVVVVLIMLVGEVGTLFQTVRTVFGL